MFAAQRQGLAWHQGVKAEKGLGGTGNTAEVWPDDVVEDVRLERVNGGLRGMHMQGRVAAGGHGVNHERQGGDVIQVGVGEQHVGDAAHFIQGEVADAGAGVKQQVVVEQKRGGAAVFADAA